MHWTLSLSTEARHCVFWPCLDGFPSFYAITANTIYGGQMSYWGLRCHLLSSLVNVHCTLSVGVVTCTQWPGHVSSASVLVTWLDWRVWHVFWLAYVAHTQLCGRANARGPVASFTHVARVRFGNNCASHTRPDQCARAQCLWTRVLARTLLSGRAIRLQVELADIPRTQEGHVTNFTVTAEGSEITYSWDFGDGAVAANETTGRTSHVYKR